MPQQNKHVNLFQQIYSQNYQNSIHKHKKKQLNNLINIHFKQTQNKCKNVE